MEIRVDREFESQIPPLSEGEFRNLEENILTAGEIYSPIIVWNGTIVDGHNRYRILQKHPELKYSVKEMSFADRSEALNWICWTQLSRRNLSPLQKKYLIGIQYKTQKMSHGGNRKSAFASSDKNDQLKQETTRQRLAREYGVSESYIQHCVDYADGISIVESISPGMGKRITCGEVKLKQCSVEKMSKIPEDEQYLYVKQELMKAIAPRRKTRKTSADEGKKKSKKLSDEEVYAALWTAMDEFLDTWDALFRENKEWCRRFTTRDDGFYIMSVCTGAIHDFREDYFPDNEIIYD